MDFSLSFDFSNEDTTYLTHSLHPYPAKFPPQLPNAILSKYGKAGQIVLDPFCGSGTTLVESRLLGFNSIGIDVNGLSVLLSKVKSTPFKVNDIFQAEKFIDRITIEGLQWNKLRPKIQVKNIEGLEHWFQYNVAEELTFLVNSINEIENEKVKNFFQIVFSSIIVKVSNQESDTRFVAKNKSIKNNYTIQLFLTRSMEYLQRMIVFSEKVNNDCFVKIYNADSRKLDMLKECSIDIVITSPPYANTYDYYLYHKFRKRWLDIDVKFAQYNEIGSRREYSSLKKPAEQWTLDLTKCLSEIYRVLKQNRLSFIVIGDSVIKKQLIKIDEVVSNISQQIGFKVCNIISSNLSEHSKMFNPNFTNKDKREHLIILKK